VWAAAEANDQPGLNAALYNGGSTEEKDGVSAKSLRGGVVGILQFKRGTHQSIMNRFAHIFILSFKPTRYLPSAEFRFLNAAQSVVCPPLCLLHPSPRHLYSFVSPFPVHERIARLQPSSRGSLEWVRIDSRGTSGGWSGSRGEGQWVQQLDASSYGSSVWVCIDSHDTSGGWSES
jgi:hypothetical protein